MSFLWDDYLVFARSIQGQTDEAALRTCVSRAYYAAFGMAAQRLNFNGVVIPPKANKHVYVWWYYNDENLLNSGRKISAAANDLKRKRVHADYHDQRPITSSTAQQAVVEASRLIDSILAINTGVAQRTEQEWESYFNSTRP